MRLVRLLLEWLSRLLSSGSPRPRRRLPGQSGALEIDYAPERDGEADPGEIVWTWVAYEDDPSKGKDRPVLVVGRRRGRLVGVALTSKASRGPEPRIEIGRGPWDREGRTSYAKLDRIVELDPRGIRREGAVLDRARFDRVARALRGA